MARQGWKGRFKRDGVIYKNASVSVYLAGTTTTAGVWTAKTGGNPITTDPQLTTDANGQVEFWLDPDDDNHFSGQLFDIKCVPRKGCSVYATSSNILLYNMQILQDDTGGRSYKNWFFSTTAPSESTSGPFRDKDIFIDTDDNNHPYYWDADNDAWTSYRDGTIATAATTATWSSITGTGKPDDNADVTGSNTALGVTRLDGSELRSGYTATVNGNLLISGGSLTLDYTGCDFILKEGATQLGTISAATTSSGFVTINTYNGASFFIDSAGDINLDGTRIDLISGTGDVRLVSAGGGVVDIDSTIQYGSVSAITTETVTGYITMKDSGGTTRKLAVVS